MSTDKKTKKRFGKCRWFMFTERIYIKPFL